MNCLAPLIRLGHKNCLSNMYQPGRMENAFHQLIVKTLVATTHLNAVRAPIATPSFVLFAILRHTYRCCARSAGIRGHDSADNWQDIYICTTHQDITKQCLCRYKYTIAMVSPLRWVVSVVWCGSARLCIAPRLRSGLRWLRGSGDDPVGCG